MFSVNPDVFRSEQTTLFVQSRLIHKDDEPVWDPGSGSDDSTPAGPQCAPGRYRSEHGHEHPTHRRRAAAAPRWRRILLHTSRPVNAVPNAAAALGPPLMSWTLMLAVTREGRCADAASSSELGSRLARWPTPSERGRAAISTPYI
jgi:hypothetical protein